MNKSYRIKSLALFVLTLAAYIFLFTWHKRKSDRATCIINIRNVQATVRGYIAMHGGRPIEEMPPAEMWKSIFSGPDPYMTKPICQSGGTYTFHDYKVINPPLGFIFCTCSHAKTLGHVPEHTADW